MGKSYKSLDSLIYDLLNDVEEVMSSEEFKTDMKNVMTKNIKETVYEAYDPWFYNRKEENGGLTDHSNIKATMLGKTELELVNIRADEETGRLVTPIIVSGEGYNFTRPTYRDTDKKGRTYYRNPRDFLQATRDDLDKNGQHVQSLQNGMKKKGYNFK